MKDSVIKIANRHARNIKEEIRLMPERLAKDIIDKNFGGFMLHNLAVPCELLVKNFGNQLVDLGLGNQLENINEIGLEARAIEKLLGNSKYPDENIVIMMLNFSYNLQKQIPTLFFI